MHRKLFAAAIAAAVLPMAALDAAAAPAVKTELAKTYRLVCEINKSDGTALKVRIMVKNTSGRIIQQGTKIDLVIYGYGTYMFRRVSAQTAYRTVYVNDSIGFDQPRGARFCAATVKLMPDIRAKIVR